MTTYKHLYRCPECGYQFAVFSSHRRKPTTLEYCQKNGCESSNTIGRGAVLIQIQKIQTVWRAKVSQ